MTVGWKGVEGVRNIAEADPGVGPRRDFFRSDPFLANFLLESRFFGIGRSFGGEQGLQNEL